MSSIVTTNKRKKATRALKPGSAAKALKAFVAAGGLTLKEAAEALHCTHPALHAWFSGKSVPTARFRKNIETWTGGAIAESAWEATDDVAPFRKGTAA